ncbi:DUF2931 family protein [Photobacterium sp.]|uniref:DUF2931 family protein n=1 Tax=Photobacterium sp. TaxID=660 RepID=UPI00299E88E4|nr:DUF2931 family protein [Photobacterium sp.]MDX1304595.1 DUF2931 family protein [Photobacterium sp.]
MLLLLSSCSLRGHQLEEWTVTAATPQHYRAKVEKALVLGESKKNGWRAMIGGYAPYSNNPLSWAGVERLSAGYSIKSKELPYIIYIQWYSLANKMAFEKSITIPESIREEMRVYHDVRCGSLDLLRPYKDNILLGLAPDGMISVFLNGGCFENELQFKVQAAVTPVPEDFIFPELDAEDKAYVDEHGVPTGSW